MKTISKIAIALSMVFVGMVSANAQSDYLLNYGPGSPSWCWQMQQQINAMSMRNAMMQAQVLNYYQQQAAAASQWLQTNPCQPMFGVMTYDGVYVTPETVNSYHKEDYPCEHCNGGYNEKTIWHGGDRTSTVRTRCTWCRGKGYVTRTVVDD